jgi:methylated-DNA-protein-cysteine methyltransferase-like protein
MDPHDTFPQRVWHIVASIPEGYVTTYGDVARLAGSPRAARQVGGVLKRLPEGSTLPWHRVVNRHGDISLTGPDLQRQRQALLAEGAGLRQRPYRSPALSLGLLKAKKAPIRGLASLLCDRHGGLLNRNQRQVGMGAPWLITVCTVSVINISWPLTVIAALSRMRAFG